MPLGILHRGEVVGLAGVRPASRTPGPDVEARSALLDAVDEVRVAIFELQSSPVFRKIDAPLQADVLQWFYSVQLARFL